MTIKGRRPRKRLVPGPDGQSEGEPAGGDTAKSKVPEVQDPVIAGDAGNEAGNEKTTVTGEVAVDEAGQLKSRRRDVDLLH